MPERGAVTAIMQLHNQTMGPTNFNDRLLLIFFLWVVAGCSHFSSAGKNHHLLKTDTQKTFAITNVNVVPMSAGSNVLRNVTVIVTNERIESLNGSIPMGAQRIDGTGKWLIPGLIDMHVHIPTDFRFASKLATEGPSVFFETQDLMTPFIANGVTTIFELSAKPEHFGQRNEIAHGDVIGPRMALAALIDGGTGSGRIVNTAADGRQAVRSAKAEGYEFIKVYSALNVDTYKAIIDEADKQGMKTVGHIPDAFRGKLPEAFVPHFGMVAHAEELAKHTTDFTEQDARRFAQLLKENGTWLSPTLTTMVWIVSQATSLDELRASQTLQYVHPLLQSKWLTANSYNRNSNAQRVAYFRKLVNFHVLLVRACKAAGVSMVTGTDTGTSGVVGGFSEHDELELLVSAGLTAEEAIACATRLAASWLGIDSLVGTVEAGKRADLVLLNANPLSDIKNTRNISGVFVNGRWVDQSAIGTMLSELSSRNRATKDAYDWKKMTGH